MAELEIDKSIDMIKYTFRWTGMNTLVEKSKRDPKEHFRYRARFCLLFNLMNLELLFSFNFCYQGIIGGESFTTLTYIAPCIAISFLGNFKSIFFIIYDEEVNQLIKSLRKLEVNCKNVDEAKDNWMRRHSESLNTLLKAMNILYWVVLISFPLMPLFVMGLKYYKTEELELRLPFLDLYPFNAYDIRIWPFAYLRQIISDLTVPMQLSGVDYLFYICSTYIRIQFKMLSSDLETLIPGGDYNPNLLDDQRFRKKLVGLVKWHTELINCVELMELLYSRSTLSNFIASAFLICLTGFNITVIDDIPFIITFVGFLIMSLIQIFVLCYFGDVLSLSSTVVSDAVFNSYWYLADVKLRKMLLIIQARAQKPCKITAFGFADVNLRAFMRVLSTSWSYFALLNTVYRSK